MDRIRIEVGGGRDDFSAVEMSLAEIVANGVNGGAAISFIQPFTVADGLRFWREEAAGSGATDMPNAETENR